MRASVSRRRNVPTNGARLSPLGSEIPPYNEHQPVQAQKYRLAIEPIAAGNALRSVAGANRQAPGKEAHRKAIICLTCRKNHVVITAVHITFKQTRVGITNR